MFWFVIALIGYAFLAIAFILDKFILDKSVDKPVVYTFYSTIFLLGAFVLYPFVSEHLVGVDWVWAVVSGVAFGLALWCMYIAVEKGEATHIDPFIGAIIAIVATLISFQFLGETFTQKQTMAIIILAFSSLLLSFEKSRKNSGFHTGFLWAIAAGIFFAVSHTSAKYLYDSYPFITGFMWTRVTTGLVGIALVLFPVVRRSLQKSDRKKKKSFGKRHAIGIIFSNKFLAVIAAIFIQYAIAIGSASFVTALAGLQYVLMFFMVLFMTRFFPKVFKEYFTKREIAVETIALVLVLIGSAMLVV